jgi:hypothetical protein
MIYKNNQRNKQFISTQCQAAYTTDEKQLYHANAVSSGMYNKYNLINQHLDRKDWIMVAVGRPRRFFLCFTPLGDLIPNMLCIKYNM